MAYNISGMNPDHALQIIANPIALRANEKTALRAEFLTDPESRGYAGKTDKEALILFCTSVGLIPNPVQPQPRVAKPLRDPELIAAMRAEGVMTDVALRDVLTMPDPLWSAQVDAPLRSDVVLASGVVPSLADVAEARA